MDDKLKSTVQKIKTLSEQNPEFAQEMRKMFGSPSSATVVSMQKKVSDDVSAIRQALEIRANNSVSYNFVKEQRLRDQLIIDNLRMENASLNLQQSETERFYTFCVNAFYQIENITNYYFHKTYPQIKDLLDIIEEYTKQESKDDFRFKRTNREENVGDIKIVHKLNALCNMLFPGDIIKLTLGSLRQVRNEGEHRCMIIQQEKDENNSLYKFFKYQSFNSVRIILKKIVDAIINNIEKPIVPKISIVTATITTMLPSACFVSIDDKTEKLPDFLIPRLKTMNNNDVIGLIIKNGRIIDIDSGS